MVDSVKKWLEANHKGDGPIENWRDSCKKESVGSDLLSNATLSLIFLKLDKEKDIGRKVRPW